MVEKLREREVWLKNFREREVWWGIFREREVCKRGVC